MKSVHLAVQGNNKSNQVGFTDCIKLAAELEENNKIDEAIKVYLQCRLLKPKDEYTFDRLIFLYHKKKDYENELEIIREGIRIFKEENFIQQQKPEANAGIVGKAINKAANFLLKQTGLESSEKSFRPQPILKWHKRAVLLQRRLHNN